MELKRDYSDYTKQDSNKSLFQEYQYFTPGMFLHPFLRRTYTDGS